MLNIKIVRHHLMKLDIMYCTYLHLLFNIIRFTKTFCKLKMKDKFIIGNFSIFSVILTHFKMNIISQVFLYVLTSLFWNIIRGELNFSHIQSDDHHLDGIFATNAVHHRQRRSNTFSNTTFGVSTPYTCTCIVVPKFW